MHSVPVDAVMTSHAPLVGGPTISSATLGSHERTVEVTHLLPSLGTFRTATDIAPIRSKTHYRRMVATLEALLDEAR